MDLHRLAEERSIAYHRAVAQRMRADPAVLARARARVGAWREAGTPHAFYVEAWARILDLPSDQLEAALVDPGQQARDLRQVTPFAGALPPRERWAIWREFAERRYAP